MDIFEQEYKAGLQKTAASQFNEILTKVGKDTCKKCGKGIVKEGEIYKCGCGVTKVGAELDTSGIMNKKNPLGIPPSGLDASSVAGGLARLRRDKEGPRGFTERVINAKPTTRKVDLTEEDFPLGGLPEKPVAAVSPSRIKLAAEKRRATASISIPDPNRLTRKERVGLVAAGSALGVGALGAGTYGAYKARQAAQLGEQALKKGTEASRSVAEQAKVVGDKVGGGADSLKRASKAVEKAVQPIIAAEEKVKSTVGKVKEPIEKIVEKGRGAKETVKGVIKKVPGVSLLRRVITKKGEDMSPTQLMMKVAAEGKVRTLEGWNTAKTTEDGPKER